MNANRPFHDEPRATIVRRRLLTIPRSLLLFTLLTLLAPVVAILAAVVDVTRLVFRRRPAMALRLLAFAWVFLAAEAVGLVWFFASWVRSGFGRNQERLVASAWPVQRWWGRTLFSAVCRLFSLHLVVEGDDPTPGPIVAMFRHVSIVDNLLPLVLLQDRHRLEMRWVIKRELLSLPALDVGGTRLPNHFVARGSGDPRTELRAIRRLASDLGTNEGVMIYPEGTRFTERRRTRALDQLRQRSPELYERAERLRHVLPPRVGGALTLLDMGYDVVVCAHVGLDGFAKIRNLWSGSLVGRTVRTRFWRISAADVPRSRPERVDWLFTHWEKVDAWIAGVDDALRYTVREQPTPGSLDTSG